MSEGGSFQIASGFVRVTAQPDEEGVSRAMNSMGTKMAAIAGGLGLGALISKGLADNLNIGQANAKLQAQMGLTKGTAQEMGKISGEVYRDNFGGSIEEVNGSIKAVGSNMADLSTTSSADIKGMSEAALGLASTFDVDVNDSTKAAGQLMKTGLAKNSTEAFDIITKGFQSGLDASGDWLDTLNEYAPHFKKIGVDGPTALGAINQFMKAGVRDTDAAADAFKEFGLRAIDGSKGTIDAYKGLGLNAKQTGKDIASGGPKAMTAMQQVFDALQKVKDPQKQNQLGTALMGTQWEDTVRAILPKIDLTKVSVDGIAGSTKKMNDTLGNTPQAKIDGVKRTMEGWVQSATQLPGPMGTISAGLISMGPGAITAAAGLSMIATNMGLTAASIGTAITATWSWITTQTVAAARAVASFAVTVATTVAGWVTMAASSLIGAAAVAAAWLLSIWPIALIIAAVVGLVIVIVKNWDTIKNAIGAAWDWVKEKTMALWNGLREFMGKAFEFLKNLFLNFTGPGIIIKHWDTIKKVTVDTYNKVKDAIGKALDWVRDKVTGAVKWVIDKWNNLKLVTSTAWQLMKDKVMGMVKSISDKIHEMIGKALAIKDKIKDALSSAGTWLKESGKKIINGLWEGIQSKFQWIKDQFKNFLGGLRNMLPFSPAKEGPFSGTGYTTYSGAALVEGLGQGIESGIPHLALSVGKMVNTASGPVQALSGARPTFGNSLTTNVPTQQTAGHRIENLHVNVKGILDPSNPASFKAMVAELHDELDRYTKEHQ